MLLLLICINLSCFVILLYVALVLCHTRSVYGSLLIRITFHNSSSIKNLQGCIVNVEDIYQYIQQALPSAEVVTLSSRKSVQISTFLRAARSGANVREYKVKPREDTRSIAGRRLCPYPLLRLRQNLMPNK